MKLVGCHIAGLQASHREDARSTDLLKKGHFLVAWCLHTDMPAKSVLYS